MKNICIFLIFTSISLTYQTSSKANILCHSTFKSIPIEDFNPTQIFITYFGNIFDSNLVGMEELKSLQRNLKNNTLDNPIEKSSKNTNSQLLISWEFFEELMREHSLDRERILLWVSKKLDVMEEKKADKDRKIVLTKEKIFIPLSLVPFYTDEDTLIEVSPYAVTQKQWVDVMLENPSHNIHGEGSIELLIQGKIIRLKPNHPVEFMTWWSALVFANRLSELHGYAPHYDLSEIKWAENTRAENGTLCPELKNHNPALDSSIFNSFRSADTNGFRLLDDDVKYQLLESYNPNETYYFGNNQKELASHAWTVENSNGKTQEVGLLKARETNGQKFYDIYGNVHEWTEIDPLYDHLNFANEGSYFTERHMILDKEVRIFEPFKYGHSNFRSKYIGLRLMRDLSSELSRSSK